MSDSISKWYDDMDKYENLCKKYKETPQKLIINGIEYPDCYGNHSLELIKKEK